MGSAERRIPLKNCEEDELAEQRVHALQPILHVAFRPDVARRVRKAAAGSMVINVHNPSNESRAKAFSEGRRDTPKTSASVMDASAISHCWAFASLFGRNRISVFGSHPRGNYRCDL
jgi:hypothetical protein